MSAPTVQLNRQRRGLAALVGLVVLVGLSLLVAVSVGGTGSSDAAPASTRVTPSPDRAVQGHPGADGEALAILRRWDAARSRAWARADAAALRRLYVPGSRVSERDVALLERYAERGLSVRGLEVQVLEAHTLRRTDDVVVLRVTDRLVGGVAVGKGRRLELPRDAASTRVVRFVRRDGGWLVAEVRMPRRS